VAEADAVIEQAEIHTKYAGYIDKQNDEVERAAAMETLALPEDLDYSQVTALSFEVRQRLTRHRPATLGQAAQDDGHHAGGHLAAAGAFEEAQGPPPATVARRSGLMPPHPSGSISDACGALGLNPSAAQLSTLNDYLALLHRWNATYNLTAVRDPQAMARSISPTAWRYALAAGALPEQPNPPGAGRGQWRWFAGCGAGHHAIDSGCDLRGRGGQKGRLHSAGRRPAALTNLHAAHARVQDLRAPPFDLITSRAFASLADFTNWSTDQLAPGGVWMAMKGKLPADEMAALPPEIEVFHVEPLAVPGLDADRCLVWMRKRGTT
jgi:16S rRNA (guanine527-N7)-methyltransferase